MADDSIAGVDGKVELTATGITVAEFSKIIASLHPIGLNAPDKTAAQVGENQESSSASATMMPAGPRM